MADDEEDVGPPKTLNNIEEFGAAEAALKSSSRKRSAKVFIDLISLQNFVEHFGLLNDFEI